MGLEPTTFELEVQHANPLRHRGLDMDMGRKHVLYLNVLFVYIYSHYVTIGNHAAIGKWLKHGFLLLYE